MSLDELNDNMEVGVAVDDYQKPTSGFPVIIPGEYDFIRVADVPLEWKDSKGNIWTPVRFMIQGGDFNGRIVFSTLSTYVGKFRPASTVQDFLAACGSDATPSGARWTAGEIKDAVQQTVGPFRALTGLELYCPECEETVIKKAKLFPRNEDGSIVMSLDCPKCGAKGLTPKATIKNFIVD